MKTKTEILTELKSKISSDLYREIDIYIQDSGETSEFEFVVSPVGYEQSEDYKFLQYVFVNQTTDGGHSGDEFAGTVCIKIAENDYLKFHYEM